MESKGEGKLKEFKIINNVLNYRKNGENWIPFSIEELSTILADKVVSQQMINEAYLESVKKLLVPLVNSISQPTDMRYDLAKSVLSELITKQDKDSVYSTIEHSFEYADAFIKKYKRENKNM